MTMLEQSEFFKKLKETKPEESIKVIVYGRAGEKERIIYTKPAAFDIETTSFATDNNGKQYTPKEYATECEKDPKKKEEMRLHAYCYIWMFGIDGVGVTYGRDIEQFPLFLERVIKTIGNGAELTVFVHNLKFEFQFNKDLFIWDKVFALERRVPVYATSGKVTFRCSYIMTGKSLEALGKECKGSLRKLAGDLDYDLPRHSRTPLTEQEWGYCENDITVLLQYIREQIEKEGGIERIPMTKTGYVRRDVRNNVLKSPSYVRTIQGLTLTADEYLYLREAFKGGYTHAGFIHSGETLEYVDSWDITSSYPATMVAGYFPMSKGVEVKNLASMKIKRFKSYLQKKCCLMRLHFDSIEAKYDYEQYISRSKEMQNVIENNGRVIYAENVSLTMTEIDFRIFCATYDFTGMKVFRMWIYDRGYLPKELVTMILKYYTQKTTLKGVKGMEELYKIFKEYVNSIYGMMVTDIVRDEVEYIGNKWIEDPVNLEKAIYKYNKSETRFLSYAWGIWVTARSRYNLWRMIRACGEDYVYTDTDSVKMVNGDKHRAAFEEYNTEICQQMEQAMKYHGFPLDAYRPKTVEGKEKPLGVYDYEERYVKFKTLGAKKYIVEHKKPGRFGKIEITVAGIGKKAGSEFFGSMEDPFAEFKPKTLVGWEHCGKLMSTYIDEPDETDLTDYTGKTEHVKSRSGLVLTPVGYSLGISKAYEELLDGVSEFMRE